ASTRFGHADDEHAIVRQALQSLGSGTLTWGDILREIKASMSGETIEVFQLFGDPAMSAIAASDPREIHLRTPQGGTLIGGSGAIPISFDLVGDGWWDETLCISYAPVGVSLWTTLLHYSVPAGQRSHTLHWTPPADGHFRIRIEEVAD
ncbi:MAG: hypothetical protein ACI8W8_004544, partial [Rhodothermales bacterium]